eukprot:9487137-Pyramimonas_sp.AAC.2
MGASCTVHGAWGMGDADAGVEWPGGPMDWLRRCAAPSSVAPPDSLLSPALSLLPTSAMIESNVKSTASPVALSGRKMSESWDIIDSSSLGANWKFPVACSCWISA